MISTRRDYRSADTNRTGKHAWRVKLCDTLPRKGSWRKPRPCVLIRMPTRRRFLTHSTMRSEASDVSVQINRFFNVMVSFLVGVGGVETAAR